MPRQVQAMECGKRYRLDPPHPARRVVNGDEFTENLTTVICKHRFEKPRQYLLKVGRSLFQVTLSAKTKVMPIPRRSKQKQ